MSSQLEMRLRKLIKVEADFVQCGILNAKLACYLARIGEFDETEVIRSDLRRTFGDGKAAKISILLMLLEGLIFYYRELGSGARDRILRANLLSSTFRFNDLSVLTSAWLAHIDFNKSHFPSMATHIRKCLDLIGSTDEEGAIRLSLVLGDAFLFSGQRNFSQQWYEKARVIATKTGDQAAIGAITYNRAALNVQNLRMRCLKHVASASEVAFVRAELQTAVNYQALARLKSLDHLLLSARVSLHVAQKNYSEAYSEAFNLLKSQRVPIESGEHFILIADLELCQAHSANSADILKHSFRLEDLQIDRLDVDDQAIVYGSLAEAAQVTGMQARAEKYSVRMNEALLKHEAATRSLAVVLTEFQTPTF